MIATYPNFSKLDIRHKSTVDRFTAHIEPYSDFNFISLFAWDVDDNTEISLLNDNLIVKMPDYVSGEPIITLIGNKRIDATIEKLLQQSLELKLVPQVTIDRLKKKDKISVIHDPDNDDYIYKLESVAYLRGKKLKKKRNKFNSFKNTYDDRVSFQEFNIGNDEKVAELKAFFTTWAKKRNKSEDDVDNERRAIDRLLKYADHFDLKCYEVWIDDSLAGFSINEILDKKYAICHFQKALVHHKNLEVYLNSLVAVHLMNEGALFANWEQHLGIDGLKQSKDSYAPIKLLKKYRISLK